MATGYEGYQGYGSPQQQLLQQALAEQQFGQTNGGQPVQSKWQGANMLANSLMGALQQRQLQQGAQSGSLALANALTGGGGVGGSNNASWMGAPAASGGGMSNQQVLGQALSNQGGVDSIGADDLNALGQAASGQQGSFPIPSVLGNGQSQVAMLGNNLPSGAFPEGQPANPQSGQLPADIYQDAGVNQQSSGSALVGMQQARDENGQFSPGSSASSSGGDFAGSSYGARVRQIESGNNPNAVSSAGARGVYQFMPSTAVRYGGNGDQAFDNLTQDNFNTLSNALGRAPTDAELYLAHQQGAGGAIKMLSNPDAPASAIVGHAAVVQNGGSADMTAGQFAQHVENYFGRGGSSGSQVASNDPNFLPADIYQDAGVAPPSNQRAPQYQSAPAPSFNLDALKQVIANPYAASSDKEMAMQLIQRQTHPEYQHVQTADGSIIAVNPYNPQDRQIISGPANNFQHYTGPNGGEYSFNPRTGQTQEIGAPTPALQHVQTGTDPATGNPTYGTFNPRTGSIVPDNGGSGFGGGGLPGSNGAAGISPYTPRPVGLNGNGGAMSNPPPAAAPAVPGSVIGSPPGSGPNPSPIAPQAAAPAAQPGVVNRPTTPNSVSSPDYTMARTPEETRLDGIVQANPQMAPLAARARDILLGNEPAPIVGAAGAKPVDLAVMNLVRSANPDFNSSVASSKGALVKSFMESTPTSFGGQITATNAASEHMGDVLDASQALGQYQSDYPFMNDVDSVRYSNNPDAAAAKARLNAAAHVFAGEYAKAIKGGTPGEHDEENIVNAITSAATPAQRKAVIQQYGAMLQQKMGTIKDAWGRAGFANQFPAMSDAAQSSLARAMGQPDPNQPQPPQGGGAAPPGNLSGPTPQVGPQAAAPLGNPRTPTPLPPSGGPIDSQGTAQSPQLAGGETTAPGGGLVIGGQLPQRAPWNVGDDFLNGALMGHGEQVNNWISQHAPGWLGGNTVNPQLQSQQHQQFDAAHPNQAAAANLAGGAVPYAAATAIPGGATIPGMAVTGAVLGGGNAIANGASGGDAATQAGLGAAGGAVGGVVGKMVGGVVGSILNRPAGQSINDAIETTQNAARGQYEALRNNQTLIPNNHAEGIAQAIQDKITQNGLSSHPAGQGVINMTQRLVNGPPGNQGVTVGSLEELRQGLSRLASHDPTGPASAASAMGKQVVDDYLQRAGQINPSIAQFNQQAQSARANWAAAKAGSMLVSKTDAATGGAATNLVDNSAQALAKRANQVLQTPNLVRGLDPDVRNALVQTANGANGASTWQGIGALGGATGLGRSVAGGAIGSVLGHAIDAGVIGMGDGSITGGAIGMAAPMVAGTAANRIANAIAKANMQKATGLALSKAPAMVGQRVTPDTAGAIAAAKRLSGAMVNSIPPALMPATNPNQFSQPGKLW